MAQFFSKTTSSPFPITQPHKLLRVPRAQNFQASSFRFSPSLTDCADTTKDDTMPIPVSNKLRNWLHNKGLQGYLRVADVQPHPRATEIVNQINVAKITNKQVYRYLNLKREGRWYGATKTRSAKVIFRRIFTINQRL